MIKYRNNKEHPNTITINTRDPYEVYWLNYQMQNMPESDLKVTGCFFPGNDRTKLGDLLSIRFEGPETEEVIADHHKLFSGKYKNT